MDKLTKDVLEELEFEEYVNTLKDILIYGKEKYDMAVTYEKIDSWDYEVYLMFKDKDGYGRGLNLGKPDNI